MCRKLVRQPPYGRQPRRQISRNRLETDTPLTARKGDWTALHDTVDKTNKTRFVSGTEKNVCARARTYINIKIQMTIKCNGRENSVHPHVAAAQIVL